jgi:hypothetical protein
MSTYIGPDVLAAHAREAFDIKPPIAFGVVQVVTKANDQVGTSRGSRSSNQAFDAVRQVLSAAMGAARQWQQGDEAHLVHPVLVVEGSGLWLYESRQEPRLVPRARLVWWGAPAGQSAAIVDVVSRAEFAPPYLLDLRDRLVTLGASISGTAPTAGPFAMFG